MHNSVTTCTKLHAHFTVPGCWDFCGVLQETQIVSELETALFPLLAPAPTKATTL